MTKPDGNSIFELIQALSLDAINVQIKWDKVFEYEGTRMAYWIDKVGGDYQELFKSLVPPHSLIKEFEVSTSIRVEARSSKGYEIKVLPLNLGYHARYGTAEAGESSISIQVNQIPLSKTVLP